MNGNERFDGGDAAPDDVVRALAEGHSRFLEFLERRIGSREVAEDILQRAYVTSIEKADAIRDNESAVAWFYRLLRNALVDHYRQRAMQTRAVQEHADDIARELVPDDDEATEYAICGCVADLIATLKPEYASMIQRIDLDRAALADVAAELGITANNAGVRLHRARQALRRRLEAMCGTCTEHACLNCTCDRAPPREPAAFPKPER